MLFKRVATAQNVVSPSFQTPADRENSPDALPHAYSLKTSSIPKYFQTILALPVPEVFDPEFLVSIGFRYAIDISFIDILKELRFISVQGKPTPRYFAFHDSGAPHAVLQDGIRDAYGRLLESDPDAYAKRDEQVFETLKALYAGQESDMTVIGIAKTFAALCHFARELERNPPQRPANEVTAALAPAEMPGPTATPDLFPLVLEEDDASGADATAETAAPSSLAPDREPAASAPEPSPAQTPPVAARQALAEIPDAPAADAVPPDDAAAGASRTPDAAPAASGSPAQTPEAPPLACAAGIRLVRPDVAAAESLDPAAPCAVQFILPYSDDPAVYDMIFASFKRHLLPPEE